MEPLVEHARGCGPGRQVPGGAVEQIRARVLGAGVLRARQRMAAHEPRVVVRGDDRPLRRAHVGHDAVARRGRERGPDGRRKRADGHRHERCLGVVNGVVDRAGDPVDHAAVAGGVERGRRDVKAGDGGIEPLACGQGDRAADQADAEDGDPQTAALESALPATAAAARTCSR